MEKLQTAITLVATNLIRSREQQLSLAAFAQAQLAAATSDSALGVSTEGLMDAAANGPNATRDGKPSSSSGSVEVAAQVGAKEKEKAKAQQLVYSVAVPPTRGASLAFVRRPVASALLGECERLDAYDTLVELCGLADALFRPCGTRLAAPSQAAQSGSEMTLVEQLIGTFLGFLTRLLGDTRWTAELLCEHVIALCSS